MSAETAIKSTVIDSFSLLRPWDSTDKLPLPGTGGSFLAPASLPSILSPMLMPHLTNLTQATSATIPVSTTSTPSALLTQVPLLSPAISIAAGPTQQSQQQANSLAQGSTNSQTSLSLLSPPTTTSSNHASMCSHLTTLAPGEDKEPKREYRRREQLTNSARTLFDTFLSSYQEQQQIASGPMQHFFPFNFNTLPYPQLVPNQNQKHPFRSPMDVVLRCSIPNCSCECFTPGKPLMRVCAQCSHGWIAHVMEKLNLDKLFNSSKFGSSTGLAGAPNMTTFPTGNTLFDIASLMLFGTHALPVRLKILLDRILCTLDHDDLVNLLHAFGWTYEDYSRGYMLQDSIGNILTKWIIVSKEEEIYIIQLFLKFPETKTIAQNFVMSESMFGQYSDGGAILANKFKEYELKKIVDCTNSSLLPKNSLLNLNSTKPPSSEINNHHSKSQYDSSKNNKTPTNFSDVTQEMENKSSRSLKQTSEDGDKCSVTNNKPASKQSSLTPVNHSSSSPHKPDKPKEKCHQPSGTNLTAPFNSLAKLDSLVSPFEYRNKKESGKVGESGAESSQFLPANVTVSSGHTVTNPLFSLASPLANFNPLLNPALLADPSKYPNAADYCKLDLTNPATAAAAAAAAAALNKNLDFSSFNNSEHGSHSGTGTTNSVGSNPSTTDAINLSQVKSSSSNHHGHHSNSANSHNNLDRKSNKHLRKSNNPTKRRWDPLILSSLTTNPATGKKRVQCSVCLKTFCDKGALKIHFSAVHLREMHKCTVEGCNMMFSSRRSRNRHSANPNPKLHTPNFRRKINPHDGRTANPYPLLSAPPGAIFSIAGVNGGLISNFDSLKANFADNSPKGDYSVDFNSMSSHSSRATPNEELMDDAFSDDDNNTSKDADEDGVDLDDGDEDNDDDICIDLSIRDDTHKSPRKRKNFNPIKFSVNNNNNDESMYVSTDDEDDDDDDDDLSSDTEYHSEAKKSKHSSDADIESDDNVGGKLGKSPENNIHTEVNVEDDSCRTENNHCRDSPQRVGIEG